MTSDKGAPWRAAGLKWDPLKSLIVPRPIGWITTLSSGDGGANTAPYSFFNAVSSTPPMVMFACNGVHADGGLKESVINALETGEFVVNVASAGVIDAVAKTGYAVDRGVDEGSHPLLANSAMLASTVVGPPRLALAKAHLECTTVESIELPHDNGEARNVVVFGRVVAYHLCTSILTDAGDSVDVLRLNPLSRLGGSEYGTLGAREAVISHKYGEAELMEQAPELFTQLAARRQRARARRK
ncbi:nitrilotriacetate monooxygenase component B [Thecamonas trahens ATCC 50062]|uniref:Nitrilotriacetate monooxygenase component B n=1 Tax=Thecamonas trahens ATCC 50062 TaxID=461836 RepID=A0A0L0DR54_THETB|nr:nitrilotriacetate monooxygenase component B [Thecamonas trahens ATCC 50062]KNC53918.1 nitrilotriacetate monooxygenase component B [Thecamonas trahens ATCC 50062]|eukprot:XP_013754124.1 nitrilotriacetate monooxygenase component B [Thecamonas trahens ATCC 50062]